MAYKARFRPSEVLSGGQWNVLSAEAETAPEGALTPVTAG